MLRTSQRKASIELKNPSKSIRKRIRTSGFVAVFLFLTRVISSQPGKWIARISSTIDNRVRKSSSSARTKGSIWWNQYSPSAQSWKIENRHKKVWRWLNPRCFTFQKPSQQMSQYWPPIRSKPALSAKQPPSPLAATAKIWSMSYFKTKRGVRDPQLSKKQIFFKGPIRIGARDQIKNLKKFTRINWGRRR